MNDYLKHPDAKALMRGDDNDPYGVAASVPVSDETAIADGPLTIEGKRYSARRACFVCTVPVRERWYSSRPSRLVDADTLKPHQHDYSRAPVLPPLEVVRETGRGFVCGARRCQEPSTVSLRIGGMAPSLCEAHAREVLQALGDCLAARASGSSDRE